jgi:predicted Fe-Mo cluster-binding NifX family protein
LFVAEPQTRDIRRSKPQNIFERAAYFAELQVDAEALEQFDQQARAFGENGLGSGSRSAEPVVSDHIDGRKTGTVTDDVEKSARRRRWW